MATSDIIVRIRSDQSGFSTQVSQRELDRLATATSNANREIRGMQSSFGQFGQAMKDTVMYGGAFTIVAGLASIPGKVIEVGNAMQGLDASFQATFKSQDAAATQMAYIRDMANRLGLEFVSLAGDYGKWAAATESTNLKGKQQQEIFESVAAAAKILNLSAEDTSGSLRALGQMVSKGKIQAEELRGQLGDRMPGAYQAMARAAKDAGLSVSGTTAELDELLDKGKLSLDVLPAWAKEMKKIFGGDALTLAAANFASETNRMKNAMTDLANTGFTAIEPALSTTVKGLRLLAENEGLVLTSAGLLATFLAARGAGALATYTGAKMQSITASRATAAADAQALQSAAAVTTAELAAARQKAATAALSRSAAAASLARARAALATNTAGVAAYNMAQTRMVAAQQAVRASSAALVAAKAAESAALAANTAAMGAATTATGFLAAASRGLNAALLLVGGPAGAAVLALGALFVYREEIMGFISYSGQAKKAAEAHSEGMDTAKAAAYEYADASDELRKKLIAQKNAALEAARASVEDARAALQAAKDKLAAAQTMADGGSDAAVLSGFGSTDSEEREADHRSAMLQARLKELDELTARYDLFGKSKVEIDKAIEKEEGKKAQATEKTNEALTGQATATNTANDAAKRHADTLKQLIEGLVKQRIELEHGKLAAEYYANRLNGLSDAEARAVAGAGQYNTYLAERQRLNREIASNGAGLKTAYLAKLDEQGLSVGAANISDAVKRMADEAVAQSERMQAALGNVGSAAAGTVSSIGAATSAMVGKAAASAQQVVKMLEQLGWSRSQAIGIAANLKQESEFRPTAVGDGGKAYGVAQWHPDRQRDFERVMGVNIRASGLEEQLKFLTYEMRKGNEVRAGRKLDAATTPQAAAAIVSRYYERPKETDIEMRRRADIATRIAASMGEGASFAKATTTAISAATPDLTQQQQISGVIAQNAQAQLQSIDAARITEAQRNALITDYMRDQQRSLEMAATEQRIRASMTPDQQRRHELIQKEFDPAAVNSIRSAEVGAAFEEEKAALERQREQLTLSAQAWRELTLSRDGYNTQQIATITGMEATNQKLEAGRQLGNDISGIFQNGITSSMQTMLHTGNSILDQLISKLIESVMTSAALKQVFDSFGNGVGDFLSGFFANGAAFTGGGVQAFANGGAFHNTVLSRPTMFFANGGLAVAGEAGPEAILPLKRHNGKLGVEASGMGGQAVQVQVQPSFNIKITNSGNPVKATETKRTANPTGGFDIEILMDQVEARQASNIRKGNGELDSALQDSYGIRRAGY